MSREHPIAPSDTVPAMLTPGEAVLNKEAADLVGRGVIAALNQKGLNMRHKGIVPVHGFADGVNEVQKPVSAAPAQNASLSPGWSTPAVGVGGDYYAQRANQIMQSGGTEPAPTKSQSPSTLSMGGTTVSKQGPSYSQASVANSTTGLTPVGGGTNAQSLVNQATQLTPPMVGLPGQGTTGTTNEMASTQAKARRQASTPPATQPMDLWSDTELTQGFADGVVEVKSPKMGDLDAMRNAANQIKYADMANKPANVTHGFGDADPYAPEPKQFKPSSGGAPEGEYRAKFTMGGKDMSAPEPSKALVPVGERGIVAKATNAGLATQSPVQKAIVPVANNLPATVAPKSTGIVPVGKPWHNVQPEEPVRVQMRGGAEGPTDYPSQAPKAEGFSPEELRNMESVKAAGRARVEALKTGVTAQEPTIPATATATETTPKVTKGKPSIGGIVAAAPLIAAAYPKAKEEITKPGAFNLFETSNAPVSEKIVAAKSKAQQDLSVQEAALEEPSAGAKAYRDVVANKGGVIPAAMVGGIENVRSAVEPVIEGGKAMASDIASGAKAAKEYLFGESAPEAKKPIAQNKPAPVQAKPTDQTKPAEQAAQPVAEEATAPAQSYTADQIKAFEKGGSAVSEGKGGSFKYVQDEQGNIVKVDTKTGNQTVMEAPSKKGIVPGGIAEGTRQFWENQGMSADPAERRAQKEMQELRAQALQGGTGDMTWAEYANANRRQKAAQGILNNLMQSRTQQGISQANLAAAKEEKAAARIAAAAEREYQHGKDEENRKLEERKLEQAKEIAGDKPVKIGDDIMPTRDVPAYQARKQKEAEDATFKSLVDQLDTTLTSRSAAIDQAMAQVYPEYQKLKAYSTDSRLSPEEKASVEARMTAMRTEKEGALGG